MRRSFFVLLILFLTVNRSPGQVEDTVVMGEDRMIFTYTILPSEIVSPYFDVSRDTIAFRVAYVDIECSAYTYQFNNDGNSLVITRVIGAEAVCNDKSDIIYALEGTITCVPKGTYLLDLEAVYQGNKNKIFRELLIVK